MSDPALAMCQLWQSKCDLLEEAASAASRCEQMLFDVRKADAGRPEAEERHLAAARLRDGIADDLDILGSVIFKTEAQSFDGATAKLAVAIRSDAPSLTDPNRPWSYLRSVLDDLTRLVARAGA